MEDDLRQGYPLKKWSASLPPNTLTNADGTPYAVGHDAKVCSICSGPDEQICIVCERSVCQKCIPADIRPGDHVICMECDKITPDRQQAYRHYVLRTRLRLNAGIVTINEAREMRGERALSELREISLDDLRATLNGRPDQNNRL